MDFPPAVVSPLVRVLATIRDGAQSVIDALTARTSVPVPLRVRLPGTGREITVEIRGRPGRDIGLGGVCAYEPTTTALWRRLTAQADVVLDVGANHGLFSILAADENPACSVVAFEPLPEMFKSLVSNIERSGFSGRILTVQAAVSNRTGVADFVIRGTSGSTLEVGFWEDSAILPHIQIPTVALDNWCLINGVDVGSRSLIKMDIETHEPAALAGSSRILRTGPAVICEVLATFVEDALAPLFPAAAWDYYWIGPEGPVRRRRIAGDPSFNFANYLFLTKNSPFHSVLGR